MTVVDVCRDIERYRVGRRLVDPSRTRADRPALMAMLKDAAVGTFGTILMFGNNFGLFENRKRAKWLLSRFMKITAADARIIVESCDPYLTDERYHLDYHRFNRRRGRMSGQTRLRVRYLTYATPWFDYLLVSPKEMKELMEGTDKVRLVAPGTDLTFSIRGIPAVPCDGKLNIPDGEVFTAPVRDSANGYITFNIPAVTESITILPIQEYVISEPDTVIDGYSQAGALANTNAAPGSLNTRLVIAVDGSVIGNNGLAVFAIDGRRVATLIQEPMAAGAHSINWDGSDSRGKRVASGTYFYRLKLDGASMSRQMFW